MSSYFLYGPLAEPSLRRAVLGEDIFAQSYVLEGYEVIGLDDGVGATLRPGGRASGVVLKTLSTNAKARLTYFGAVMECETVELADALTTYVATQPAVRNPKPWNKDVFSHIWVQTWRRAITDIMAWHGRKDATAMRPIRDGFFRRAWSFASNAALDGKTEGGRVIDVHAHHRPYANFFAIDEWDLRHTRHDGTMSVEMNRAAMLVGNAAVVLPYDPARDTVLLVEQVRTTLAMAGERNPWVWEPVAGLVDAGETPEQTAKREAQEEAGLTLDRLEPAGRHYASTGALAECIYLYVGICDLSGPVQSGGVAEEGEDIRSQILSFADLMTGVDANEYVDLPLVTLALWLSRHRARLRA